MSTLILLHRCRKKFANQVGRYLLFVCNFLKGSSARNQIGFFFGNKTPSNAPILKWKALRQAHFKPPTLHVPNLKPI